MTPRERLLTALSRREPSEVPVDLGGTATSTITRQAYVNFRTFLGLPESAPEFFSFTAQSVRPHSDFLDMLRIDTRGVKPRGSSSFNAHMRIEGAYEYFSDESGIGYRRPLDGGLYYDMYQHPLKDKEASEIEAYRLPWGGDPARVEGLREECLALREAGYPVILSMSLGGGILHEGTALFGFEDYFTRFYLEQDLIDRISERILQNKIEFYTLIFGEIGDLVDVVTETDDLGTQRGPFISPDSYRKRIKPYQARLFAEIHRLSPDVKICYHSCGSIVEFIPDLIEIGADALNPLQLSAKGMDPVILKREYGRDICFWGGGIDTQHVLPRGSAAEVKDETRRRLDQWLPGGGYVFAAVHNIQDDVPPEHIAAVFEVLDEYR